MDPLQAVCEGPYAQGESAGSLGGDAARIEVGDQRLQQRLHAAARLPEGAQGAAHQVGHCLPVAGEDREDQQVGGAQDRRVQGHLRAEFEGAQGFLVGVDDAARAGVGGGLARGPRPR
ncbi:hypothetical protein GCM10020000_60870 [Streptomyces olivoverticillatus]